MSSFSSSTLPPGHPPVHEHLGGQCPIAGKTHAYCPPQDGDVRSVCPALNTMANHGYLPRDGQNITFGDLFHALKDCYGLSSTLATVLTAGGFIAIKRSPFRVPGLSDHIRVKNPDGSESPGGVINLHLVGLHNAVEHDASLVHVNAKKNKHGPEYGPVEIKDVWVPKLVGDIFPPVEGYSPFDDEEIVSSPIEMSPTESSPVFTSSSYHDRLSSSTSESSGYYSSVSTVPSLHKYFTDPTYLTTLVDESDVGRMRARRQREILPDKLDPAHAEIARGEMSIILGVWGQTHDGKTGIPLPWLLKWLAEERLPEVPVPGESETTTMWRPNHKQTLSNVIKRSKMIKKVTEAIEKETLNA